MFQCLLSWALCIDYSFHFYRPLLGLRYVGLLHCHYGERGGLHALGWRRAALALRLPQSFHLCFYNLLLRTASPLGALGISLVEEKARR